MTTRLSIALATLLLITSCGGGNKQSSNTEDSTAGTTAEEVSYAPGTRRMERKISDIRLITTREQYLDYIDTYWDGFDFDADSLVVAYDTLDMCQAMADYVTAIEPHRADSLLRQLMHRAERSRPVLDYMSTIAEIVLHDPNSPLRNDEYYIPILEVLVESPLLDEYDRMIPAYDLQMARNNRLGHIANDFEYTLLNGRKGRMHKLDAEYLLIMLNNPGCPMCKEITMQITSSPLLNELTERGVLKVLAIYPDNDLEAWRNYQPEMPTAWISGYDDGMRISYNRTYDLKAIPALYLLDRDKRVLIKDGVDVGFVEHVISQCEATR